MKMISWRATNLMASPFVLLGEVTKGHLVKEGIVLEVSFFYNLSDIVILALDPMNVNIGKNLSRQ